MVHAPVGRMATRVASSSRSSSGVFNIMLSVEAACAVRPSERAAPSAPRALPVAMACGYVRVRRVG